MNKMFISIIVPVYNAEKYLAKCIDSVLSQSYTNFELLLIDDGSTDSGGQICDDYAKKDNRIKVIHQKNAGVSAARNHGIRESKGDYICFIDADDWVNIDYLETYISVIKLHFPDFIISGYTYDFISSKKTIEYSIPPRNAYTQEEISVLLPELHNNALLVSIWSKFFKKSIINNYSLQFDETINYWEDTVFCWNFLLHVKSISVIENAGYHYRKDDSDSLTKKKYSFDHWFRIAQKVIDVNQLVITKYKLQDNEQILQKINDYFLSMYLTACYSMYEKKHLKNRHFRLKQWKKYGNHNYMRIKPEESIFVKFIKRLLLLKQFYLVDLLMIMRSKMIKN
jgi:glycosyltransferase involved in cell wall biosynthesis